jgi:hypothetical protein
MLRTRQLALIACLTSLVSGPLAGCAASAIDDPELATDTDDVLANEDQVEDGGDDDGDEGAPPTTKRDASTPKDAATPPKVDSGVQDAGSAAKDASVDAGSKPADASAPKDASTPKDASAPPATRNDAGKPADPPPSNNECTRDSQCKNVCIAVGILPCCNTLLGSCGCTWAPGAYCL